MSDNRLTFDGLSELRAALRALPETLAGEGGHIVEGRANQAAATIKAGYPERTGKLRDKLQVEHERNRFGATSVVKNTSKYADEFDYGTQARHNALGANRGSMPPNHLFTQTVRRKKREMYQDLNDMLVRNGLVVTGDA